MPLVRATFPPLIRIATGASSYTFVNEPLGTPTTLTATQSLLYQQPWYVPNGIAITEVGVNLAGAVASSVVRQGFYADNGNYYPGNLIYDAGFVGTINGNQAAGYYTLILPTPLLLSAGLYWAALVSQGAAASLRGQNTGITYSLSSSQALASLSQPPWVAYQQASVTGVLPQTFTTTRTITVTSSPQFLVKIL